MIYYFSGTGNSKWAAEKMALFTEDRVENLVGAQPCDLSGEERLGVVFPIYAWDVPGLVRNFLQTLEIPNNCFCYAVCTCGKECGRAVDKLSKLLPVQAAISVAMPDNYVVMMDVEPAAVAKEKITTAEKQLRKFADRVRRKEVYFELNKGALAGLKSSVVSAAFSKFAMNDKPFTVENACVESCTLCETVCPVDNIAMTDGKPLWQGHCIQCMACINRCPQQAIQYGKRTKKRGRYYMEAQKV